MVASFGKYVMAIDALAASGDADQRVLWSAAITDGLVESPYANIYRRSRGASSFAQFGQSGRWFATDDKGLPIGVLGPITQHGIAFQTGGRLKCVDPLTGRTNWERDDLPAGFRAISTTSTQDADESGQTTHIVFSDGVAKVSVFIEAPDGSERSGWAILGASNSYTALQGEHQVTAVGEVPGVTVQRIAASMRRE